MTYFHVDQRTAGFSFTSKRSYQYPSSMFFRSSVTGQTSFVRCHALSYYGCHIVVLYRSVAGNRHSSWFAALSNSLPVSIKLEGTRSKVTLQCLESLGAKSTWKQRSKRVCKHKALKNEVSRCILAESNLEK